MDSSAIVDSKFVHGLCGFVSDAATTNDPECIHWDRLRQYLNTSQVRDELLQDDPEALFADRRCEAPLHLVCAKHPPTDVVASLLEILGLERSLTWLDENGMTPLHCALASEWPVSGELFALIFTPQIATIADTRNGSTPMHLICQNRNVMSEDFIQVLKDHCDVSAADALGRTPLHLILGNADHPSAAKIVSILLSESLESSTTAEDGEGKIPLHHLASRALEFSADEKAIASSDTSFRNHTSLCFDQYMKLVNDHKTVFFKTLDRFPQWLKNHAALNDDVQELLDKKLTEPFFASIILLEFYNFISVICCLGLITSFESSNATTTTLLIFSGIYFFIREALEVVMHLFQGQLFKILGRDILDQTTALMAVMVLAVAIVTASPGELERSTYIMMAVTAGLAWCGAIALLRSVSMTFAIFWAGIFTVLTKIVAYMATLALIMLSFAEMLYIIAHGNGVCADSAGGEEDFAFCTYGDALLRLYTMSVGEVTESDFYHSPAALALYIVYLYAVVILLANILAYVIGSHVYNTANQTRYFWLYQLDFVVAMEDVSAGGPFYYVRKCMSSGGDKLSRGYKVLLSFFVEDKLAERSILDGVKIAILRLLIGFAVAPVWFLLGAATCGYLWPPQVTEMIFHRHPKGSDRTDNMGAWDSPMYDAATENSIADMAGEIQHLDVRLQSVEAKMDSVEAKLDLLLEILNKKQAVE